MPDITMNDKDKKTDSEIEILKKRMKELEEREHFYNNLINNVDTGMAVLDYNGTVVFANSYALRLLEATSDEIIGKDVRNFLDPSFHTLLEQDIGIIIKTRGKQNNYYILKDLKGKEKWIDAYGNEIMYKGSPAILVVLRDVTIRKKIENALEESHELFKTVVDIAHEGLIMINRNYQIVYANSETCRILNTPPGEIIGHDFREFITPNDRDMVANIYRRRQKGDDVPTNYEMTILRKDGIERRIELSASTIQNTQGDLLTAAQMLDVTEKRMLEEELLNMRKLESVGILAGGIAHDFNNILNAILGNLSLLKLNLKEGDDNYSLLIEAEKAILRARGLTNQLLTFSKGGAPVKKALDIGRVLHDGVNFSLTGSNVKSRFYINEDLWFADIDEGQIYQVINNIILNAKQAMPEGGYIDVHAANFEPGMRDKKYFRHRRYIVIKIQDNGTGILPEHLSRIFDPYFSTKEEGQGLGLASVYSIIKRHGGRITVDSESGEGSLFTIFLPASKHQKGANHCLNDSHIVYPVNKCNVLFMDDDEMVRSIAEKMLKRLGCSVTMVQEGREAIIAYSDYLEKGTPFDVVIMDLTIPGGMGGKETISLLQKKHPQVKAIVSSGYSNDPVMSQYRDYGFSDVITKPFKIEELCEVLSRVIQP